jgi:hypothetical protein
VIEQKGIGQKMPRFHMRSSESGAERFPIPTSLPRGLAEANCKLAAAKTARNAALAAVSRWDIADRT